MTETDYLIIGAGITGISFANFIKSDKYIIVEKEKEPGGYCKTIYQDGFTWDYSGHFFHFNDREIKEFVFKNIDLKTVKKVNKVAKIWYNNNLIDFPFQKNIHQLDKDEFIKCLTDLFFANTDKHKKINSFNEMVIKNYGKSIANRFLIPYNEKLYACNLNLLDKDAMGRFFPEASFSDVIKNIASPDNNSYNSVFYYPKKGAVEYVNSLLQNCNPNNISLNEQLIKIDIVNCLAYTNKRKIKFKYLINTVPFNQFIKLIKHKAPSGVLSCNKVLVFNIGFDTKGPKGIHWMYFPEKKYNFYRIGFYDNIFNSKRMSLYVEIGAKDNDKIDVEKQFKDVIKGLKDAKIITTQKVISKHTLLMNPAYVHVSKKSNEFYNNTQTLLNKKNIFSIGRYGGWKYCSIEDNIIEAKKLAKKIS